MSIGVQSNSCPIGWRSKYSLRRTAVEPQSNLRLISHDQVTKCSNALQFKAAAYSQVILEDADQRGQQTSFLISSPYNEKSHLLDLNTLEETDRMLATALTLMTPIRSDYATAPYQDSFNWAMVFQLLRRLVDLQNFLWIDRCFYVVIFRSKRSSMCHMANIHDLDAHAHQEATVSGGLLKYWFGEPDEQGQNLATCIWRSRDDARRGGAGPGHARAMKAASVLYEHFSFTRLALRLEDNLTDWQFSEWTD